MIIFENVCEINYYKHEHICVFFPALLAIFKKACIVIIKSNSISYFFITVLDVDKLRCKHLKRKM